MYIGRNTTYILQAACSVKFILQSSIASAALGQSILSHSRYDLREFSRGCPLATGAAGAAGAAGTFHSSVLIPCPLFVLCLVPCVVLALVLGYLVASSLSARRVAQFLRIVLI